MTADIDPAVPRGSRWHRRERRGRLRCRLLVRRESRRHSRRRLRRRRWLIGHGLLSRRRGREDPEGQSRADKRSAVDGRLHDSKDSARGRRGHWVSTGVQRNGCTVCLAPRTSVRPCSPDKSGTSKMMGAERDQQDDRDRNTDQPQQDGAHDQNLLLHRSGPNNGLMGATVPDAYSATAAVAGSARCSRRPSIAAWNMMAEA